MNVKIFVLVAIFFSFSQTHAQVYKKLRSGDILFQNLNCGDLCDAIETVTFGVNHKKFSHCAFVVQTGDSLQIIEAIGNQVKLTSLIDFFERSNDTNKIKNITVGRLQKKFTPLIKPAVQFAIEQVGKPYDDVFLLNNNSLYCSELLYEAFKSANGKEDFFVLEPMTFKDPATKQFFPAWVTYYQALQTPIPEGELGLNPGSISRSPKIEIIRLKHFQ